MTAVAQRTPEELIQQAQAAREESVQEYHTLARRTAFGESIDPSELARVSASAGLAIDESPSTWTSLVERYRHRRTLRAKIERLKPVEKEMAEVRTKIDQHNAILEVAVQHHQRVTAPLQTRIRELRAEFADASTVSSELIGGCPDLRLKKRSRQLQAESERLSWARTKAVDKALELHGRSKGTPDKKERIHTERLAIESDGVVQRLDREIEKIQADSNEVVRQILEI